MVSVAQT
ncbi:hypothetical protein IEO21_10337 [Rhodonia placenta]|nr:hypothetical protein IEO21_10412 [Postia placenta]KAF9800551.1 hypothetical protein IEO21_10337 [Postia placenta]